jgi:hypothetical protein
MIEIITLSLTGVMPIDTSSTDSFFGFSFDGTTWKLKKFDLKEKSFSLCTFTGNLLTYRQNFNSAIF